MLPPKNSAEVAIRLFDHARFLGLPVKVECSMVARSDSRYIIIYPGTVEEAVIRISSHKPNGHHYALCLGVHRPDLLATAVSVGISWMEQNYAGKPVATPRRASASEIQEAAERRGLADADVHQLRRSGHGHRSRGRGHYPSGADGDGLDGLGSGATRRSRNAGAVAKWTSSEARRIRDEWAGDD
jgi:hypothetical protein